MVVKNGRRFLENITSQTTLSPERIYGVSASFSVDGVKVVAADPNLSGPFEISWTQSIDVSGMVCNGM